MGVCWCVFLLHEIEQINLSRNTAQNTSRFHFINFLSHKLLSWVTFCYYQVNSCRKMEKNLTRKKNPVEILRMATPHENNTNCRKKEVKCSPLIFADREMSNMNLQQVFQELSILTPLCVCITFWCHSFLWIYFASGWQNRGENKTMMIAYSV